MIVCVVGTGYVGLVTGSCLAYLGHQVKAVDVNEKKIAILNEGGCPIFEPGLPALLEIVRGRNAIAFSTDLASAVQAADVVFIAVGTPPDPNGEVDLSALEAVARGIGSALDCQKIRVIVNKSTVPIGSGDWVTMLVEQGIAQSIPMAAGRGSGRLSGLAPDQGPKFTVASNPEFLREGSAIADTLYPDRIVLGTQNSHALDILRQLYGPILEQTFPPPAEIAGRPQKMGPVPLVTTDLASAEIIKYAANAFLATKISFINEMSNLCEKVGADVIEVARGIGLDNRIGPQFLNAGLGWGGSCFRKDVSALMATANEYHIASRLLRATLEVNLEQRQIVIGKLQEALKIVKGKVVGLMGLAFKPNTDDLRDAPSLDIARTLLKMGARVKVYDPVAMPLCQDLNPDLDLEYCDGVTALALGCDAIVVVTEWSDFSLVNLDLLREGMRGNVLVDGRNFFAPELARQAGFLYLGIGR